MKPRLTLLTGGSRSGKSTKALELAKAAQNPCFLATAQALDEEMQARIQAHQAERGEGFALIEEPLALAAAIRQAAQQHDWVLVDCLTLWLGNLLHHYQPAQQQQALDEFLALLAQPPVNLILVTNEVGWGIVPENALAREFRDRAGFLNQNVARLSDTVILMVSGLPLILKSDT